MADWHITTEMDFELEPTGTALIRLRSKHFSQVLKPGHTVHFTSKRTGIDYGDGLVRAVEGEVVTLEAIGEMPAPRRTINEKAESV